jgi:hypothetical protein
MFCCGNTPNEVLLKKKPSVSEKKGYETEQTISEKEKLKKESSTVSSTIFLKERVYEKE